MAVLHPDGEPRRADGAAARAPLEDLRVGRIPRDCQRPRRRRTGAGPVDEAASLPGIHYPLAAIIFVSLSELIYQLYEL